MESNTEWFFRRGQVQSSMRPRKSSLPNMASKICRKLPRCISGPPCAPKGCPSRRNSDGGAEDRREGEGERESPKSKVQSPKFKVASERKPRRTAALQYNSSEGRAAQVQRHRSTIVGLAELVPPKRSGASRSSAAVFCRLRLTCGLLSAPAPCENARQFGRAHVRRRGPHSASAGKSRKSRLRFLWRRPRRGHPGAK